MKTKFLLFVLIAIINIPVFSQFTQKDSMSSIPLQYLGLYGNLKISPKKVIYSNDVCYYANCLLELQNCIICISESKPEVAIPEKKDVLLFCSDSTGNYFNSGSLLDESNASVLKNNLIALNIFITLNQDIFQLYADDKGKQQYVKLNINTKYYEGNACVSSDGNTLYFSSNRVGGFGNKDLYSSEKLSDGTWSEPYNLGPKINTLYDEESPYIMHDDVTLYFSSKGHDTFGGFDIFMTTLSDEGFWSDIENAGFIINSGSDELNYISDKFGRIGFYTSDKEKLKQFDIYFVKY